MKNRKSPNSGLMAIDKSGWLCKNPPCLLQILDLPKSHKSRILVVVNNLTNLKLVQLSASCVKVWSYDMWRTFMEGSI